MSLIPRLVYGDLDLTDVPYAWEFGGEFGAPQNVAEVVASLLQDGEIVSVERRSNRTISLTVQIEWADMDSAAEAETALVAEADKPFNTLTLDPGDGYGAETVFETFAAQVQFIRNDDEEQNGVRRYVLTIPALPHPRGDTEVVVEALATTASPTTATVADGSSATNWTSTPGTVSSSSGYLTQSSTPTSETNSSGTFYRVTHTYTYTPASPVDMSTTIYLSLDFEPIRSGTSSYNTVTAYADGSELPRVADVALTSPAGWRRVTFICSDASVASFRFDLYSEQFRLAGSGMGPITTMSTKLDNVQRTNQAPLLSTTGRMSLRTFTVQGSAPAQARLGVSHETAGLGTTIVYTCPELASGYTPDLRRWRTAGGTVTADAATVSGSREPTSGGGPSVPTFNVPASMLPKGGFTLHALMRSTSGTITATPSWTVATKIGSTTFAEQSGTGDPVELTTGVSSWKLVPIGGMTLPTTALPDSTAATVQITFQTDTAAEYDEAFLFYAGKGAALSVVSCGAGTPSVGTVHNRLWLDSATLDSPVPALWLGTQADRADAFHGGTLAQAWEVPTFPPGEMVAFVATRSATYVAVEARYYPRFFGNAQHVAES